MAAKSGDLLTVERNLEPGNADSADPIVRVCAYAYSSILCIFL